MVIKQNSKRKKTKFKVSWQSIVLNAICIKMFAFMRFTSRCMGFKKEKNS